MNILILMAGSDKDFCEKDNLEDIALADRLTKALFITHENDGIAL